MEKNRSENARIKARRETLRRQARATRDGLDEATRRVLSSRIAERVLEMPEFVRAERFLLYAAFRGEVETAGLRAALLARGKVVCLPLAVPETKGMRAVRVDGGVELAPGFQGIPEPRGGRDFPPEDLDVVVVPGLLFDRQGNRLGYGGGYYDRFLADRAPRALRVGLGFACQVAEGGIPAEPHDARLDVLVTEEGVLIFA